MLTWEDGEQAVIGGSTLLTMGSSDSVLDAETIYRLSLLRSTTERLVLLKTRRMIEYYLDVLVDLQPERVLELGIYQGGSVALVAEAVAPERLVAIDLAPQPVAALDEWIAEYSGRTRIATYYGVDQTDTSELDRIVESDFDGPLDLVIDDASHWVTESRISFSSLFPRLRAGGVYLIEDWSWAHRTDPTLMAERAPLTLLLYELIVACAHVPELIERIEVGPDIFAVKRGPALIGPEPFDIARYLDPRALELLPSLGAPG
jgi:predicted O-methyltransferase YrrM